MITLTDYMTLNQLQKDKIWTHISKIILNICMTPGALCFNVIDDLSIVKPKQNFNSMDEYQQFVYDTCEKFLLTHDTCKWCLGLTEDDTCDSGCWRARNDLFHTLLPVVYSDKDDGGIYIRPCIMLQRILYKEDDFDSDAEDNDTV